jgi:hypothetical protein
MCMTLKPISFMARITLAGGEEPPVWIWTTCSNVTRCSGGVWISMVSTVGAPHMWVTRCWAMRRNTSGGSTRRRQTWVPPTAVTAHG